MPYLFSRHPHELVIYLDHLVRGAVYDFFFVDNDAFNKLVKDTGVEFLKVGVFLYQVGEDLRVHLQFNAFQAFLTALVVLTDKSIC